jgi:hypothetical protein
MTKKPIISKWNSCIFAFSFILSFKIFLDQVCNENGNCHCNPGWKCPNCTEAYDGPGGSIDNGLSCQAAAATRLLYTNIHLFVVAYVVTAYM